jgi:hypothetical protein
MFMQLQDIKTMALPTDLLSSFRCSSSFCSLMMLLVVTLPTTMISSTVSGAGRTTTLVEAFMTSPPQRRPAPIRRDSSTTHLFSKPQRLAENVDGVVYVNDRVRFVQAISNEINRVLHFILACFPWLVQPCSLFYIYDLIYIYI